MSLCFLCCCFFLNRLWTFTRKERKKERKGVHNLCLFSELCNCNSCFWATWDLSWSGSHLLQTVLQALDLFEVSHSSTNWFSSFLSLKWNQTLYVMNLTGMLSWKNISLSLFLICECMLYRLEVARTLMFCHLFW